MSLFGRLAGKESPRIPAGGRAFVYMSADGRQWSVRVAMPGEEQSSRCRRISPVFAGQVTAYAYLAWVTGDASSFSYPPGSA